MMALDKAVHMRDIHAECTILATEVGVKEKTGTALSTLAHILTAMVGAGVLAMPKALGDLGWIAGPAALVVFFCVSILAARCLACVFEVDGVQHPRYYEAVRHILGRKSEIAAAVCQLANIFLVNIAYIITASLSMQAVAELVCNSGESGNDTCFNSKWTMSLIFGGTQLFFAQVPNLEESGWVSVVGALTAVAYSAIALGLSLSKVAQGSFHGTVGGIPSSSAGKAFNVLNALGSIGFAFSFSQILLEIQDCIREPPESKHTMIKASRYALSIGACFYLSVAVFGYMAFGSAVPDDILTAFDNPKWLVILAHMLVILHMVAAYNVFAQTFFLTLEGYTARLFGVRHPAEEAALKAAAAVAAAQDEADALRKASLKAEEGDAMGAVVEGLEASLRKESTDPRQSHHSHSHAHHPHVELPRAVLSVTAQRVHPGDGHTELLHVTRSQDLHTHAIQISPLPSAEWVAEATAHEAAAHEGGAQASGPASRPVSPPLSAAPSGALSVALARHQRGSAGALPSPAALAAGLHRAHSALSVQQSHYSMHSSNSVIHAQASLKDMNVIGVAGPYRMHGCEAAIHPRDGKPRNWTFIAFTVGVRAGYVAVTTILAVLLPFFSQITGLIGSATFFPLTIYFPFTMYIKVYQPPRPTVLLMYIIMLFMFLVAGGATVASIRNIATSKFQFFS